MSGKPKNDTPTTDCVLRTLQDNVNFRGKMMLSAMLASEVPEKVRGKVQRYGIGAHLFADDHQKKLFSAIMDYRGTSQEELHDAVVHLFDGSLQEIQDFLLVSKAQPDYCDEHYTAFKRIADKYYVTSKVIPCLTDGITNNNTSAETTILEVKNSFYEIEQKCRMASSYKGLCVKDFITNLPPEEPLFKGDWLSKGQAALITSVTGSGKSTMSMQMALAWSIGREMLGLRPVKPLKIGIMQTEDSRRDVNRFIKGLIAGFKAVAGWTDDDVESALVNTSIFHFEKAGGVKTNREFLLQLQMYQQENNFDLVIMNPLQAFTGFDIAENAKITQFVRDGIDPIIRGERGNAPFGLIIVHHTPKPQNSNQAPRYGRDVHTQYLAAGGSDFANWKRSELFLLPIKKQPGYYLLSGSKHGELLGWPEINMEELDCDNPCRLIRRANKNDPTPLYWFDCDNSEYGGKGKKKPMPTEGDEFESLCQQFADEFKKQPLYSTPARKMIQEIHGFRDGNTIYKAITANLEKYGLVFEPVGKNNTRIIGTKEAVDNYLKSQKAVSGMK